MASCLTSKRFQVFSILIATAIIVTVLLILFISNWPSFARQKIVDNLVFRNGSMGMQRFQDTSDLRNLRLSFTVFSVDNVDQVIKSAAKIQLKEYGPFVYHEYKWKEILENNQTTGLISYKLRRRFVFKPELSVGDPKKISVTWLNVPVLSAASYISQMSFFPRTAARIALEAGIKSVNEQAFITDTVDNFIFSGSYRQLFALLYNNTIIRNSIPKWPLPDNKFALLYNRNNSWSPDKDYIFTMAAGLGLNQSYSDLNQYKLMNGSSQLPFWGSNGDCNTLEGTDGEFFSPFLNSSTKLGVYSLDICRKLNLKFRQKVTIDGISTYRYTLDDEALKSAKSNPSNACYCTSNDSASCQIDGLIDLSKCVADNVYASGSHFLYGSPILSQRIAGLREANRSLDEPIIHVEPNTGLSIKVKVPLQFNIMVQKNPVSIFGWFQDIDPLLVPLLTVTEAAELEHDQAVMLREKLLILDSWFIVMVLGGAIILILLILVVISIACMRLTGSKFVPRNVDPSEREPLLGTSRQTSGRESREGTSETNTTRTQYDSVCANQVTASPTSSTKTP